MSGTSLDGIDAAFILSDGRNKVETGPALTVPYDDSLRAALRSVLGGKGDVTGVERALTEAHAHAVATLRERDELDDIDIVGFHGHTILHAPATRRTWQIGDGALLADLTGLDVVCDFRSADVAAGGEGAPFAPLYHAALAAALERPLAVLNIGGVANVTWIGEEADHLLAFDTGPGNAPLDDWVSQHTGNRFDADGALALAGCADDFRVAGFLAHPYFARTPPKSLDRDEFGILLSGEEFFPADGAATLTAMIVGAIRRAAEHFPAPAKRWLVTGGGRHNRTLMAALAAALQVQVMPVEAVGWNGDALEAQAFGYLALRSLDGLALSLGGTTGVPRPMTGGSLFRANRRS
jgi:anhydro-N-acetylmuramic acid kinase